MGHLCAAAEKSVRCAGFLKNGTLPETVETGFQPPLGGGTIEHMEEALRGIEQSFPVPVLLLMECEVKRMPNIKSAKKRVRVIETKSMRNQMVKSALKTSLRRFQEAIASGDKATAENTYRIAVKKVDQATAKGILHKNAANRKKSQLAAAYNKAIS